MLTEVVTVGQRDRLLEMLRTPAGRRLSTLERLRRPIVDPSISGLIGGLERERELRVLAEGLGGLDALPVARLRTLMVDAERQRAADIAKMGAARRLATLIAFAITASERGQDDALELFDRLHGELILRAQSRAVARSARALGRRSSARHREPQARGCLPSRAARHDRGAGPRCCVRGRRARRARRGG
jgi:hypothetical protein